MVYANYCAPYPKQSYVVHEVNMWYSYCMMLLVLEPSITFSEVLSQISYSLVVILELSGVLEVQYKEIMMSSINKDNCCC